MKSLLFSFICFFPLIGNTQVTLIPDSDFEQRLVNLGLDNVLDGQVLTANIDTVQSLNLGSFWVNDLTGIQNFTALRYLYCQVNSLSTLDLSQNLNLIYLNCGANDLTNLDVSNNVMLESLSFYSNNITSIDLSQNSNLKLLYCRDNELTNLDVSSCPLLETLRFENNLITSIDLSQNPLLRGLNCGNNLMTSLDLSQNDSIVGLTFHYNNFNSIDVSNLSIFKVLDFEFNNLTNIDVTQNPLLEDLYCWNNQLNALDLSQNGLLRRLYCQDNQLMCLNVKNGFNQYLYAFNTTNNPNLWCIEVDDPSSMSAAWSSANGYIDPQSGYSNYCENACTTGQEELDAEFIQRQLLKIVDVTGKEAKFEPNKVLFYLYTDGTVERIYHLE